MKQENYKHAFRLNFNGDRDSRVVVIDAPLGRIDTAWTKLVQQLKTEAKSDSVLFALLGEIKKIS